MILKRWLKLIAIIITGSTVFLLFGCTAVSQETVMMEELEGVKMSATELSIRLNEFGKLFAGAVEEAADEIIENTDDLEVKKNALLWKTNAVPAALKSLTILDPVAAGIDLFALCYQMQQFFSSGYGKDLFKDQQVIAIDASNKLVYEAELIANEFRDKKYRKEGDMVLAAWVIKNPLKNLKFNRRSTFEITAKTLGKEEYGLGSTVGSIAVGVHDIRRQITVYTEFLPKQIKWQAEYELYNLMEDSSFQNTFNNLDRIVNSTERITNIVEYTPDLIKELQLSSLSEINRQRLQTLQLVSQEREAILNAVTKERIAVMNEINREREESLDRIEKITNDAFIHSSVFAGDVIDKIFWRVLIILALAFAGGFILIMYYKK